MPHEKKTAASPAASASASESLSASRALGDGDRLARPRGGSPVRLQAGPRVFEVLLGSWSQGLARPESDIDWRGVFVSGPSQWAEPLNAAQEERSELAEVGVDAVFWSQWRFAQLLEQGNFTALKLLFCEPEFIERDDGPLAQLRETRDLFLSKQTVDGLGGVSLAQIRALDKLAARPRSDANDAQLARVSSHALRLARMSLEVAKSGEFLVRRADAAEILAVKSGERPWADAAREAEATARKSRSACASGPLREKSDEELPREWSRALFHSELARRGADASQWADQPGTGLALPVEPKAQEEIAQKRPAHNERAQERGGKRRPAQR